MCGIAGIINYRNDPVKDILNMNRAMLHRGPDAGDYWLDQERKVVLGHRRLSIVDLSENGAQPMKSADGRYVIVYNGEIYNYQELEQKLRTDGCELHLRGTSDTEVILEAFSFYGMEKTLSFMKGMFAIALYDRQEQQLYLMRDRVGEKPLYYGMVNGAFAFASDIECIRQIEGFSNQVNRAVFPLYFQYGYIPAPYSIYEKIYKLEPGKTLRLDCKTLDYKIQTYWSMTEVALNGEKNRFTGSEEEAAGELERLLKDAIKGQMIADVPLGAFLSGGIDSSLVVSLMQSLSQEKIKTFTIGFDVDKYNEARYAKEIAAHLGTEHTELYVTSQDAFTIMQHMPDSFTEPFADSSQIPTMLVSKMTREHVTVALSGDAGDELFCGYTTYMVAEEEMRKFRKRFHRIPEPLRHGAAKAGEALAGPFTPTLYKIGNYLAIDTLEQAHADMGLEDARTAFLAGKGMRLTDSNHSYRGGLLKEPVENLMLMDLLQYHPDDILVKVDRAGMFYSLENRVPMLDRDVVEFAWRLPLAYKMQDGVTKRVMRDILYRYVPREMMERPKKGFSIPIETWMREEVMYDWATDILSEGHRKLTDMINQKCVDSFWKDYVEKGIWTETIWYILLLEQWLLEKGNI